MIVFAANSQVHRDHTDPDATAYRLYLSCAGDHEDARRWLEENEVCYWPGQHVIGQADRGYDTMPFFSIADPAAATLAKIRFV